MAVVMMQEDNDQQQQPVPRGPDAEVKQRVLQLCMVYPRTESVLSSQRSPVVSAKYTCDEGRCDFNAVFAAIKKSQDLHAWGVQPMVTDLVSTVNSFQEQHIANLVDGFQINRDGQDLLRFEREGAMGKGRMGFIEFSNYRQEYLEQLRAEREERRAQSFEEREKRLEEKIDYVRARIDVKTNTCAIM